MCVIRRQKRFTAVVVVIYIFGCSTLFAQVIDLVIDPGHGGSDHGALSPSSITGYDEKDANLDVALLIRDSVEFIGLGWNVLFTRDTDVFVTLDERALLADSSFALAFISIHHNGSGNASVQGTEVFWSDADTTKFFDSTVYFRDTTSLLSRKVLSLLLDSIGYSNRGAKTANFFVLRNTFVASALSEASFITELADAARLKDDSLGRRGKEASAIIRGWQSFEDGQGFGRVDYALIPPGGGSITYPDSAELFVDSRYFPIPYERT
jgi:N-acetylmuramoyl-L-alanine amidase